MHLLDSSRNNTIFQSLNNPAFISKAHAKNLFSENRSQQTEWSPLDTCATHTYRLKIGNSGSDETVNEITTISQGNILVAGKINNGTTSDALLVKLDNAGSLVWSRSYGDPASHDEFTKARETNDGGVIIIGSSNPLAGDGWVLISKMDANGNQQWTKRLKTPASPTFTRGADIVEMKDGHFLFIADNSSTVFFGKMTPSGSLIWSKTCTPLQTVKAIGVNEDYNGHFMTITGIQDGFNVAEIFKVALNDGALVWSRRFGGAASNTNYIFHKVEMINLRPRITGIYSSNGQPYKFIRVNVNTGSAIENIEEFVTSGVNPDVTARTAGTPWSQAMAFSAVGSSGSVNLVRNSPDIMTVDWSVNLNSLSAFSLANMERASDAGFFIAGNSNNDIILIKTDSTGLQPGCDRTSANTSRIRATPSIPSSTFSISNSTWSEISSFLIQNTITLTISYSCKQITCPPKPVEDTCLSSFHKTYRSYEFCEVPTDMIETSDNHLLVSGVHRSAAYEPSSSTGFLAKIDKKGNLVSKKRYSVTGVTTPIKQIRLRDGNIITSGWARDNSEVVSVFVCKYDNSLNIIWSRHFKILVNNSWMFNDITETADGELFLYLLFQDFPNLSDKQALIKLDNLGNLVWQKTYRSTSGISIFGYSSSIVSEGNQLYMSSLVLSSNSKWQTVIIKADKNTGNIEWSKNYHYSTNNTQYIDRMLLVNNKLYLGGFIDYMPGQSDASVLKVSLDGFVEKTVVHRIPNASFRHKIGATTSGEIVIADYLHNYNTTPVSIHDFFLKLDGDLNILNSKKVPTTGYNSTNRILGDNTGDIYNLGSRSFEDNYNVDFFLKRYTADGMLGSCASDSFNFEQYQPVMSVTDIPYTVNNATLLQNIPSNLQQNDFGLQQNQFLCGSVSGCDTLWMEGVSQVCDSTADYTFTARKNPGCFSPVSWQIVPATVQVIQSNDSLLVVRFPQNGNFRIKAKLYTGCRWLQDSTDVLVQLSPSILNLGPDTALCEGNSRILNAGRGFSSYLWQNGSTDSTLTVNGPGTYWVEVSNACNVILRDSVIISPAPPVLLELGPDLSKCNDDTLGIAGPPGFMNYSWSPNYHINSTFAQNVSVFPMIDTIYHLRVEKTPGCFGYDSIRIHVNTSPQIDLGADASFCKGDSIALDAGPGFSSYQWSTGASTASIIARQQGVYTVQARAINGCISFDTISVLNVHDNPQVNLGNDQAICNGFVKQLDAGTGFQNYLWSTGEIDRLINVNTAGTYWVRVTDLNQCKGTDTLVITGILPLPAQFLPADTLLCSYNTMKLKPAGNFVSYLWSTGSVSRDLTIQSPGTYWLEVKGSNGCVGRDSVNVKPKQCLEGFYMPTGFTPNNDGKNDKLRPLLFGKVLKYEFTVYNRWGGIVFRSTDLQKGWSGKEDGITYDSNVFIWTCSFQFEGQQPEFRKGTVVLIR